MTVPTPDLQHPYWCLRRNCAELGAHTSRALVAADPDDTTDPVTVGLMQLLAGRARPQIGLTTPGDAVLLSVDQARILRRYLGRLVDVARRADR
jgi:hypothetical protein